MLVLIYCQSSAKLCQLRSVFVCTTAAYMWLTAVILSKMITWNMHISPSEHQYALSAIITSVGSNMEKFVCSCVPLNLYFLRFHPSPSESSWETACYLETWSGNTQTSLLSLFCSHTHCIYCIIFKYLKIFNVAVITLLLFEMIWLFLDTWCNDTCVHSIMNSPLPAYRHL